MPHGLFLGSPLATQDSVFYVPSASVDHSDPGFSLPPPTTVALPGRLANAIKDARVSIVRAFRNNFSLRELFDKDGCKDLPDCDHGYTNWENRTTRFIDAHLYHSIVDIVLSLLGFAVLINSM